MSSLNRIILVGEVAYDPDVRVTTTGDSMLKMTLKIDRPARSEEVSGQFDMIPVVAWRQVAEDTKTAQRGAQVMVEGRIITRSFEDESGNRRYSTEVDAKDIKILSGFAATGSPASPDARDDFDMGNSSSSSKHNLEQKPLEALNESDFDFGEPTTDLDSKNQIAEEDIPF